MTDSENQSLDMQPGPEPSAAHIVFSEFFFEEAAIALLRKDAGCGCSCFSCGSCGCNANDGILALSNARFTDVKIILGDEPQKPSYKLHKLILAAHSTFFRNMFRHDPKEVYEIGAVSKKRFEDMISYLYGGTLTLDYNNFDEILEDVIYLQLDKLEDLMKAWEGFVKGVHYVRFKASYYPVAGMM